jgi:Ulp1 family protease
VKVIVAETTEIVESSGNLLQSEKEVKVVSAETTGKVESSDNLLESEKEVIVGVAETTEYTESVETKVSELEKVESSEDLSLLENVLIDDSGTIVTQLTEFETVVPFEDLVIGENVQIMNKEYSKCYVTQSTQQKEDANETISVEPYQEVVKAETALERFDRDLLFVYPFIGGVEIENLAEKLKFDEKKMKLSSQEIYDLEAKNVHKKPVCIYQRDLDCLKPKTYVNDDVISFWFRWIYRREEVGEGDSYVLDTFFYNWLTNDTSYGVNYCVRLHQNVVFVTKKFIYVPIN